jgi:tripartite-type tricarboxylate transporter receptor subunit TctC
MKLLHPSAAILLCALVSQAAAQGFPNKAVHVVITFGPGTATDIVGRVVTQKLSELWGQPVVVDNRVGAGGAIGSAAVAKAAPDGYTLLLNSSSHTINPAIFANLPYDTLKDFTNIAPIGGQPNVLVVNSGSPIRSFVQFVDDAKTRPGKVNFGSAGTGSGTHLNLEKFKVASGIDVVHVPYKGSPEVFADIMGGRLDAYFAPISAAMQLIRDGKLRPLAVSSAQRAAQLPEVPTIAESGFPNFEFTLWFGIWGPAGMPNDVVERINRDTARAVAAPEVKKRLADLGNDTAAMSPAEFSRMVRSELEDVVRITRAAGLKPQ